MEVVHKSGCACGAMRFGAMGAPRRISLCFCTWCRKRTGSLLGVSVYFDREKVEFLNRELKTHRLRSDAGRWIEWRLCIHYGSALTWTLEFLPSYRGITRGTFEQPEFIRPSATSTVTTNRPARTNSTAQR